MDRSKENEAIARIFRKRITWIKAEGEFGVNGITLPRIGDTIFIDVNTDKFTHAVMGHELSHTWNMTFQAYMPRWLTRYQK